MKLISKDIQIAIKFFEMQGCTVLQPKHKNSNGPDLNIIKNDEAFRIEIKQVRKKYSGSWQIEPILENRKNDDYVLIMYKNEIIELISMKDHLKLCAECGSRILTNKMKLLK